MIVRKEDGSLVMAFPMDGDKAVPHLEVNADTGNFVYAVSQLQPGKSYMAAGTECGWKASGCSAKPPVQRRHTSTSRSVPSSRTFQTGCWEKS